jgi:hypothetical protein
MKLNLLQKIQRVNVLGLLIIMELKCIKKTKCKGCLAIPSSLF